MANPEPYVPPTDAEIARKQAAIADAYDHWVSEMEDAPPARTMNPTGDSEYPTFAYLIDATQEQRDRLTKAVHDAIAGTD